MKIESMFLLGIAVFFGIVGAVYWFTSYEQAGTMMLVGSCLLGILPGSYYYFWHRRMKERVEDRDATIAEGQGVISSFPGSSIWPFVLGLGAFVLILGLVFGTWLLFPGAGVMVSAVIGATAESRRGGHV